MCLVQFSQDPVVARTAPAVPDRHDRPCLDLVSDHAEDHATIRNQWARVVPQNWISVAGLALAMAAFIIILLVAEWMQP